MSGLGVRLKFMVKVLVNGLRVGFKAHINAYRYNLGVGFRLKIRFGPQIEVHSYDLGSG